MGKKRFLEIIGFAAQPLEVEEKSVRFDDYTDRQILRRMRRDNEAKRSGKSRPKTAGTARKTPRRGS